MKALSHRCVVIAGIVWLLGSCSELFAGDLWHLSGRHTLGYHADCGCGTAQRSHLYVGSGVPYGDTYGQSGYVGYGFASGVYGGRDSAWGGLTGFEGLPHMDGGGVNHRYPYHSYRRPWAHPGPPSTNVSIVW